MESEQPEINDTENKNLNTSNNNNSQKKVIIIIY